MTDAETDNMTAEEWLAIRKAEAKLIDPFTAVDWQYGWTFDPYDVLDLPEEEQQAERQFFARRPDGDIWVSFMDLPDDVCAALWKHINAGTANWEPKTAEWRQAIREELGPISRRFPGGNEPDQSKH